MQTRLATVLQNVLVNMYCDKVCSKGQKKGISLFKLFSFSKRGFACVYTFASKNFSQRIYCSEGKVFARITASHICEVSVLAESLRKRGKVLSIASF